jgi:hypothetical protein
MNKQLTKDFQTEDIIDSFDDISKLMGEVSLRDIEIDLFSELEAYLKFKNNEITMKIKMLEFETLFKSSSDITFLINFVIKNGVKIKSKNVLDFCRKESINTEIKGEPNAEKRKK